LDEKESPRQNGDAGAVVVGVVVVVVVVVIDTNAQQRQIVKRSFVTWR